MPTNLIIRDLSEIAGSIVTFVSPPCQNLNLVYQFFLHHLFRLIHTSLSVEVYVKFFPHLTRHFTFVLSKCAILSQPLSLLLNYEKKQNYQFVSDKFLQSSIDSLTEVEQVVPLDF